MASGAAVLKRAVAQAGPLRLVLTGAVLLLALLAARYSWNLPVLLAAERGLYDVRAALTAPRTDQDPRIVLVVFTEKTLASTGKRSPLDRNMLARAITNIDRQKPRAIGVDILIDQPQTEDPALVTALLGLKTPTFFGFSTNSENAEFVMPWQEAHMRQFFARVAAAPVRTANIRLDVDSDNAWRAWPNPVAAPPPLLVDAIAGAGGFDGFTGAARMRQPRAADRPVFASLEIDLFADPAVADALQSAIAGKIVLIGADLPEADRFITPLTRLTGKTTPGVELHASLIAQALDGVRPEPVPAWALWLAAVFAVMVGTMTGGFDVSTRLLVPLVAAQLAGIAALPVWLQSLGTHDTLGMPAFGLAAGWLAALMAASAMARSVGAQQRRFAQGALGKYLPRDVAQQILRDPEQLALKGERREIYALFTDIEGFTAMCQSQPPEVVAATLNDYLDVMSNIVLAHGGTIDKFVGDAVVAFWGAPLARPDDAARANACAVAMARAGEAFRTPRGGRPPLGRTRVGLHHGRAVVGNFGGEGRIQYTALGDSMNVAARLEGANKQLHTAALVSREAAQPIGLDQFRAMGRVRVRGRDAPIEVFEPLGAGAAVADRVCDALVARFEAGDRSALDALRHHSAAAPDDRALAYLVTRLDRVGPGGCHDLD